MQTQAPDPIGAVARGRLRRYLLLAGLLGLAALRVAAQEAAPSCLIVYGSGRNFGDAQENAAWDRANALFNAAVVARLAEAGLRAQPLLLPVGGVPPAQAVARLLELAQRQGCRRIVDTAVFASEASDALVLRLRVHPLLGAGLGPLQSAAPASIGEPLYTAQREFPLNRGRPLEPARLQALAREMAAGYLEP
ncbi:MAG: hypothetical protein ABW005_04995 [Burkholderiaceae bacterium]